MVSWIALCQRVATISKRQAHTGRRRSNISPLCFYVTLYCTKHLPANQAAERSNEEPIGIELSSTLFIRTTNSCFSRENCGPVRQGCEEEIPCSFGEAGLLEQCKSGSVDSLNAAARSPESADKSENNFGRWILVKKDKSICKQTL